MFSIYILLALAVTNSVTAREIALSPSQEWDLFMFVQIWPSGACTDWKSGSDGRSCHFPTSNTSWTIHGLWPNRIGTIGPHYCSNSYPFNESEIADLVPEMTKNWISIQSFNGSTDEDNKSFWKHEWEKHGQCSLSVYSTELEFFTQVLNLKAKYDAETMLLSEGIVPSPKLRRSWDIWFAFYNQLQVKPVLYCYDDEEKETSYVEELRICFNKALTPIDCTVAAKLNNDNDLVMCMHDDSTVFDYSKN